MQALPVLGRLGFPARMAHTYSVHLIAAHPVARESYAFLMDRQPDLDVSGQSRSVKEALKQMQILLPDAILLSMPTNAPSAACSIRTVRNEHPNVPLIVVTATTNTPTKTLLDAGATACMARDQVPFDLLPLLRHLLGTSSSSPSPYTTRAFARPTDSATRL